MEYCLGLRVSHTSFLQSFTPNNQQALGLTLCRIISDYHKRFSRKLLICVCCESISTSKSPRSVADQFGIGRTIKEASEREIEGEEDQALYEIATTASPWLFCPRFVFHFPYSVRENRVTSR